MKIILGSDHAGFEQKEKIKQFLLNTGNTVVDKTPDLVEGDDYSDTAKLVAKDVTKCKSGRTKGILLCGSGIGMSIAANRVKGIRAALCTTKSAARLSREHNNANILALAGREEPLTKNKKIIQTWLTTSFSQKQRHVRRIQKLDK